MKLSNIAYRTGSQIITNQDLLDKVNLHSKANYHGDLDEALSKINHLFNKTGCKTRRWLNDDEQPIDLVCQTINEVLDKSQMQTKDVDMMIHVGLGRGFLEAGQAYFVAQAMKMRNIQCFDIMDACNSWTRGLFLADTLLKSGAYKNILVVNTECNMMPGGIINPGNFQLSEFDDVDHCFPGMTLGDAVSATLLTADEDNHWDFEFSARTDCADLCAVPVANYDRYSQPSQYLAKNGVNQFTSFGALMQKKIVREFGRLILKNRVKHQHIDWLLPHGHTKTIWETSGSQAWDIPAEKMKYNSYEYFGNFASACVPVSIAQGMEAGEIKQGQRLMTAVASGGLSFSSACFVL